MEELDDVDVQVRVTEAWLAALRERKYVEKFDADAEEFMTVRKTVRGRVEEQKLPLTVGYFRRSNKTNDVRRCPDADAGCGGTGNLPGAGTGKLPDDTGNPYPLPSSFFTAV